IGPASGLLAVGNFTGHGMRDLVEAGNSISVLLNNVTPQHPAVDVTINHVSDQNSPVSSITVTFHDLVTLDPGAITLQQQGGDPVTLTVTEQFVGDDTVVFLTFPGPDELPAPLPTGSHTLTIHAAQVHADDGSSFLTSDFVINLSAG